MCLVCRLPPQPNMVSMKGHFESKHSKLGEMQPSHYQVEEGAAVVQRELARAGACGGAKSKGKGK